MNQYPIWKNLLVAGVFVFGLVFALPNYYGEDPALQIALETRTVDLGENVLGDVQGLLDSAAITYNAAYLKDGRVMVRFNSVDDQLVAVDSLRDGLGTNYIVALTLESRMPDWLRGVGLNPMRLGLDLRGGVYTLYEVDIRAAVNQYLDRLRSDMNSGLREKRIRTDGVSVQGNALRILLRDEASRDAVMDILRDLDNQILVAQGPINGKPAITATMTDQQIKDRQDFAIDQNITTMRNRVNELGVAEPLIQRQGLKRIVIQLPGVQDPAEVDKIMNATATLEFRLVDKENNAYEAERVGRAPLGSELFKRRDGTPVLLERDVIASGEHLTDASAGFDEDAQPAVFVNLNSRGARKMLETTARHLGDPMAVLFIETKNEAVERDGETVFISEVNEEVISVATIQGIFGNRFQITGLQPTEARDLALLLRAGALAAPIAKVEQRTVGPSLGQSNIDQGFKAVVIGFFLVITFMIIYYRLFGLVANLALLTNVILVVSLLSMLQAVLTLPGIAGIVLTVGMAVDANVLIFERIREELRNGNTPQASIHAGYEKAFSSIADANITTLIAAVVLLTFGTGPIKGFAITLMLGIITSMFTAIVGTRAVINAIYGGRRVEKLAI